MVRRRWVSAARLYSTSACSARPAVHRVATDPQVRRRGRIGGPGRQTRLMLAEVLAGVADLVLPTDCAGCGSPGASLCGSCRPPYLAVRHQPTPAPARYPPTWVWTSYDGPVRSALLAYKEHGRRDLTQVLGAGLAAAIGAACDAATARSGPRSTIAPVLMVPIPSRPDVARRRGGDHVRRLVRQASPALRNAGVRVEIVAALRVRGRPADAVGLTACDRVRARAGAFAPTKAIERCRGRQVIVVDDLVTSGATLAEARRVLSRVADGVRAAALAGTLRRNPDSTVRSGVRR